jgi:hypothetical protein
MRRATLAAVLVCLTGCAEDKLYDVTGTVTHGGAPLPAGVVWFDPDPNHPGQPPQGYAYVKDGKFDTTDRGRGVKPGAYTVRVEGFDGKPGNELPLGKPLFTDFEEKREFAAAPGKIELDLSVPRAEKSQPKGEKPQKPKTEKSSKPAGK